MTFPKQPQGMDSGFYRQLRDAFLELEREVQLVKVPKPAVPVSIPIVDEYPIKAPSKFSTGSAQTFTVDDMGRVWHINATGNFDLTLPAPFEGAWIEIFNYGTNTITIKNSGGVSIGTRATNEGVVVNAIPNSSGAPEWPTAISELATGYTLTSGTDP